ncbi:MAG: protein kinase [Verrucomicrobiaceae bacterium]|nr:protein kinase [Verrucomicrobiaceae bacterium]
MNQTTHSWLDDGQALFDLGLSDDGLTAGDVLGNYELRQKVGEGGLGVVFRAEQLQPVKRTVALKLIRTGFHSRRDIVDRFHQERRSLARMQHPHIATLLDAGNTEEGIPYFVMEYVSGQPLTSYCQEKGLDLDTRLELFTTICEAVQHAHQKGVVHRDLKPSNILIAEVDGRPVPKIIDFGIARVLSGDGEAESDAMRTRIGERPSGTYPYMSPEQATGGQNDIDTRSDVYTLGVILYELVSGKLPLPDDVVKRAHFEEIARQILEVDPPLASTRAKQNNSVTCDSSLIQGELDWIIQRAMEKDPNRRYTSAAALADDLHRFLHDEPITARPPAGLYLLKKWLKRHRIAVTAASVMLLGLVSGLIVALSAYKREAEERARADAAKVAAEKSAIEASLSRDAAVKSRQEAERARDEAIQARTAEATARNVADAARARGETLIADMLYDLRDQLEPHGLTSLLARVSDSAEAYFQSLPQSSDNDLQRRNRAAMHQNRGNIFLSLGETESALAQFDASLKLIAERAIAEPKELPRLHDLALAHERLGIALEQLGRTTEARKHYEETSRVLGHLTGEKGAWEKDLALAHERLGDLELKEQHFDEARRHFEAGLRLQTSHRKRAIYLERLGTLAESAGDYATASARFNEGLAAMAEEPLHAEDRHLQAAMATLHGRLCAALLKTKADHAVIMTHAQQEQVLFARLHEHDPANREWKLGLGFGWLHVAASHEMAGDAAASTDGFARAISIFKTMRGTERELAAAQVRLSAALLRSRKPDQSRVSASEALETLKLLPDSPESAEWRRTAAELAK